jgi:energy-converting hydrogenase B subunit F
LNELVPLLVVAPLFFAVAFNYLHGRFRLLKYAMVLVAVLLPLLPLLTEPADHFFGGHTVIEGYTVGIQYSLQSVHKSLILLLFAITSLILFSAVSESERLSGVYVYLIFMGAGAVAAVLMVNDIFNLYVFIEIAAISQAGLVIVFGKLKSLKTALKYLLMGSVAGNLFLLGVAMLLGMTGTLNITDLQQMLTESQLRSLPGLMGLTFMFLGLTYVSGLIPFHNIKSSVYAHTTGHAGALLQSQAKLLFAGLVLILFKLFGTPKSMQALLLFLGFTGMAVGAIMALSKKDIMEVLGYVSVSQAGLIAVGFGLYTMDGLRAALFHTINDIVYMSALFLTAGYIYYRTKTTELSELGGLVHRLPSAALLFGASILAVSAVPPFSGFQSELRLIVSALDAGFPELSVLMVLVSVATFVALTRVFYMVFLRGVVEDVELSEMKGNGTLLCIGILVLFTLLVGVFPDIVLDALPVEVVAGWLP